MLAAAPDLSASRPAAPAKVTPRWLIGPVFDLVFVANLVWPLWLLLGLDGANPWVTGPLTALQVYFLSTPHRWITLALVFLDRDRLRAQPLKFGGLGLGLVALGLALVGAGYLWPRSANVLVYLMMLDYVWNAWHFAAQHAGIARIYGRIARPDQSAKAAEFEKSALRILVLWVFLRLALAVARYTPDVNGEGLSSLIAFLGWLDPVALAPALFVVVREAAGFRLQCLGRLTYIGSVVTLYVAQLWAIRAEQGAWMSALFLAGAVFHATEYLAVVSWSVRKKTTGVWAHLAPRYALALLVFMTVLMVTNMALAAQSYFGWALVTLLVSLLHYGYDGIIWKGPRKS